jgi:GAF domain-containing protein
VKQVAKIEQAENPLGLALVNDPTRNKGTAFTEDERMLVETSSLLLAVRLAHTHSETERIRRPISSRPLR